MESFNRQDWEVRSIGYDDCKEWFLHKHYAHRIPSISFAFGLYRKLKLEAVCSFGMPPSPSLVEGIFGGLFKERVYELNRLCANDGLPRNALSFFVSQCLKMLPSPLCVVSYADSGQNHHGYIYQATNFLYTGLSSPHRDCRIGEENKHSRHLSDKNGNSISISKAKENGEEVHYEERSRKHRYFYFIGSKRQVREMKESLKYKIRPYPKGDNTRYDATHECAIQGLLF